MIFLMFNLRDCLNKNCHCYHHDHCLFKFELTMPNTLTQKKVIGGALVKITNFTFLHVADGQERSPTSDDP